MRAFTCLGLSLLLGACTSAPAIRAVPRYSVLEIEGDLETVSGAITASSKLSGLGLDDDRVLLPRVDLDWNRNHLTLSGLDAEFEGTGLEGDVNVGLGSVTIMARARTTFEFGLWVAQYHRDLFSSAHLDLGLGLGVGMVDTDITITALVTSETIQTDADLPFAYPSMRIAARLGGAELVILASGISAKFDDGRVSFLDIDAGTRIPLFGSEGGFRGALDLGYRMLRGDFEYEDQGSDIQAETSIQGPYIGLGIWR